MDDTDVGLICIRNYSRVKFFPKESVLTGAYHSVIMEQPDCMSCCFVLTFLTIYDSKFINNILHITVFLNVIWSKNSFFKNYIREKH